MAWLMIWAFAFEIYQIEFETEGLCERAKAELVEHHDITPEKIACVQVVGD